MKKLPYISDKALYAAVMGACSYARDTGHFNKATSYYAEKYDVDVEDVRKYVRFPLDLRPEMLEEFKKACERNGTTATTEIKKFITSYCEAVRE